MTPPTRGPHRGLVATPLRQGPAPGRQEGVHGGKESGGTSSSRTASLSRNGQEREETKRGGGSAGQRRSRTRGIWIDSGHRCPTSTTSLPQPTPQPASSVRWVRHRQGKGWEAEVPRHQGSQAAAAAPQQEEAAGSRGQQQQAPEEAAREGLRQQAEGRQLAGGREGYHCWKRGQNAEARCLRCGLRTKAPQPPGPGCIGIVRLVQQADPSHQLMAFEPIRESEHPIVVACMGCHRTGTTAGHWNAQCSRCPTESRTDSVRRLRKGQPPTTGEGVRSSTSEAGLSTTASLQLLTRGFLNRFPFLMPCIRWQPHTWWFAGLCW